ncbi:VTT domain-containing protein [Hyphomicrobiales bacterium]|jgi:membrane protein YqaA with SNARE-associated domain|nr:VTT domain-containing protein [Hyphomicrobiales bacterium]MDB9925715.1 VTT domain-containing protein [Hyphomicrobiales bacterium]|tara:strand:- start:2103 stop:2684 length:582 start_codon:yes stop_codon:yes gene_type:complete
MNTLSKNLYKILKGKKSARYLYAISFSESIFFPIPTDTFLIPMALANRDKAISLGLYTTLFSVIGGAVGYLIGLFFFDTIGINIIESFNLMDKFKSFSSSVNKYGYLFIFIAGFTPIPYKIAAITSGVTGVSFPIFIIFSLFSRGLRFLTEVILCRLMGDKAKNIIKKYSFALTIILLTMVIGIIILKEVIFN